MKIEHEKRKFKEIKAQINSLNNNFSKELINIQKEL